MGYIIKILKENEDIPFLVAGDFNEHIQFPLLTKDNNGNKQVTSLFDELNNNFSDLNWWDGEKNTNRNTILESAKTNLTVNKIRGPGTNQPFKANEYEHQFIDWNFGKGIRFKVLDKFLQEKVSQQIYNNQDILILKSKRKVTGDDSYNLVSDELNSKLIPNTSENSKSINCISDHLPMTYKINVFGNNLNVLQMNLLAQGLSEDGFLGGSSPDKSILQKFKTNRGNYLALFIEEINNASFDHIYTQDESPSKLTKGEEIDQLGNIKSKNQTNFKQNKSDLIKLLTQISQMNIDTINDILSSSKNIWKNFGPVLTTSEFKKEDVAKRLFKEKKNMYTFIQCLLGVNNSEILLSNSKKIPKGPWAIHSEKIIKLENRIKYLKQLINNCKPDIVCFQEDDFSWFFMDEMNYTCSNNTKTINDFEKRKLILDKDRAQDEDKKIPYSGHIETDEGIKPKILGELYSSNISRFVKVPGNGKYITKKSHFNDGVTIWWKK